MTTELPTRIPALDEPIPFRRLIDEAGTLFRRHFRTLFLPIALPIVALQVVNATGQIAYLRQMNDLMISMREGDLAGMAPFFGYSCLATVLAMVLLGLANAAAFSGTANAVAGRPIHFASHWGHTFKPRVLVTVLMLSLSLTLGYICCLLPGILLTTLWGFAISATVEDDLYGSKALARSYQLSGHNPQGEWTSSPRFKIFVLLVVGWILSTAVSLLMQMPLQIVQQIMTTRQAVGSPEEVFASNWFWLSVPNAALGALGSSAVLIYLGFGLALLYWDVRRRSEGSDLEAELEALEVPQFSAGLPPETAESRMIEPPDTQSSAPPEKIGDPEP